MRPKDHSYENPHYEAFIRSKPCLVCGVAPVHGHHDKHARRNCYMLVPLCEKHHMPGYPDSYHQIERDEFEIRHRLTLDWEIQNLLSEYIELLKGG